MISIKNTSNNNIIVNIIIITIITLITADNSNSQRYTEVTILRMCKLDRKG